VAAGYQTWIREVSVRAGDTGVVDVRMLRR
jgi:hypothetical protein